mmetsp:Transcript_47820/g.126579  ORF Transcript_47820/g.126579 Transcript_47820/m.126579 type:complete len:268 (-) Transcript_47820:237-1040(-)|eukprot:CAMPEP_0194527708 /NCGR_PEP_ID=MMETSP0253-20130528/63879_1 /TAXON_ID=2966 /ORGANISM="Noctiluca scintillans" /LENGTH=267 /DNA_ID=CAMNT_0039372679 /DNA_START=63 /DNA_END=866 /DNA_ORIENTATION=+
MGNQAQARSAQPMCCAMCWHDTTSERSRKAGSFANSASLSMVGSDEIPVEETMPKDLVSTESDWGLDVFDIARFERAREGPTVNPLLVSMVRTSQPSTVKGLCRSDDTFGLSVSTDIHPKVHSPERAGVSDPSASEDSCRGLAVREVTSDSGKTTDSGLERHADVASCSSEDGALLPLKMMIERGRLTPSPGAMRARLEDDASARIQDVNAEDDDLVSGSPTRSIGHFSDSEVSSFVGFIEASHCERESQPEVKVWWHHIRPDRADL